MLNARRRLGERQKSLRSNQNRHLARVRKGRSKISRKVKNFSDDTGFDAKIHKKACHLFRT